MNNNIDDPCEVCECEQGEKEDCENYIDYPEDNNCCLVSIYKHDELTLEQVAERMDLTYEGVRYIQQKALEKLDNKFDIDSLN